MGLGRGGTWDRWDVVGIGGAQGQVKPGDREDMVGTDGTQRQVRQGTGEASRQMGHSGEGTGRTQGQVGHWDWWDIGIGGTW